VVLIILLVYYNIADKSFLNVGYMAVEEKILFFGRLLKRKKHDIDYSRLPEHIAIIMDGNGRWARKRGLSRSVGHREGSNTLKKMVAFCEEIGIKHLTVFAFSTENWKRPKSEVDALMSLLKEYLRNADRELAGKNVRINVIGDISRLSPEIQSLTKKVMESTRANTGMNLNIALNYGGRDEIIKAVQSIAKKVAAGEITAEGIDEKTLSAHLYTSGIPDPDLLIRTSGEKRLSNFLIWQSAYSEFWFTDVLWPDFKKEDMLEAISAYQKRIRRFGGI